MLNSQHSTRYQRQLQLPGFGPQAQEKLLRSKVLVVGAGGLGVPVLQYLTGMGVGTIGVVDDDVINVDNLHRQVLYTMDDIGQPKAQIAAKRLNALNPGISISAIQDRLDRDNALSLIAGYDVIVDATDNFSARYLINDACVILNRPFVYGALHHFEAQLSVFNFNDGPTYRCLYPVPPAAAEIPDCNEAGVLGVVPGIVGCRQALESVKLITGIGRSLSGYLLISDLLNGEERRVKLKARPENKEIKSLQESYELICSLEAPNIQPHELQQWYASGRPFVLVDVREAEEYSRGHLPLAQNCPLSVLDHSFEIAGALPLVVYCQKGSRSPRAVEMLLAALPGRAIYNLSGGMDSWTRLNSGSV